MSQWYKYPVVSVSATNPSVGPNGSPAPTSSTEVAGQNPSGNLQPLQTNAAGSLLVAPDPATMANMNLTEVGGAAISEGQKLMATSLPVVIASDQSAVPISAASLPLPTGAATSALQTSGNSSLASILANQTNGTQETQVTSSVLPTGAATSALQTSGNSSLGSILADMTNGTQVTQVSNFPATQPVSGTVTANQGTAGGSAWPVSVASLPLPTGAATSALQTSGNSSLTSILANQTNGTQKVLSTPVTPAALTVTQAAITVGTSAVRLTVSGSAPASTRVVLVATPDAASSAKFYIGSSSVTATGSTRGVQITSSQVFAANNDAGDYWIVSDTAGQVVEVMEQA